MIQDIAPHVFDRSWRPDLQPDEQAVFLLVKGRSVLVREEGGNISIPGQEEAAALAGPDCLRIPLFSIDQTNYFLLFSPQMEEQHLPEGYRYLPARRLCNSPQISLEQAFALATAVQLGGWYRDNVFCGSCGSRTRICHEERALDCPGCGRRIYPRIVPAVIVGVTDGDRLLETRYGDRELPFYALVAGFCEIGETLEDTVRREVMEETGLAVKNIRYYKSQPWGFDDDLLAGFFCDVDGDSTVHIDHRELKSAVWMDRKDVVCQPRPLSLTNEMMEVFRDGREPKAPR